MEAVLFDLDGTLLDTRRVYAASYHHAFETELGKVPSIEEFLALRPVSERIFLVDHYGPELGGRIHDRVVEHYAANVDSMLDGFYDGVEEMLAALRARDLRLGIVTGKSRAAYQATARHVDLSGFEVVVVEDDVPLAKPDPAGIRAAMEQLAIEVTVYVGDSPTDVEAAQRAGVQPAAALWPRGPASGARMAARLDASVWALETPAELLARLA